MAPKKTEIAKRYVKLDQKEHVLARPGMYIGSVETDVCDTWVYSEEQEKMVKRQIKYVPGLFKIFDEVLVNAIDHSIRLKTRSDSEVGHHVKNIKVAIDVESGVMEVTNDGDGIEIVKHPEHGVYIPELIFGNLLTSTNYDDTEEKTIGGQNGIGAKCISHDTRVPLFNGDIKLAKDIRVGDILIGDDGMRRTVLDTLVGHGTMYEVSQTHGETYKVNDEHILTLHMPDHKVISWSTSGWKMVWWDKKTNSMGIKIIKVYDKKCIHACDTEFPDMKNEDIQHALHQMQDFAKSIDSDNIIDISIKDYLQLPKTTQDMLEGVRSGCVNWDHMHVDLDPYVLGSSLANGHHDVEVKKHIPKEYIINNREVRLNVLAGLIDADESALCDGTHISITPGSKVCMYDIIYLARSLGFDCSLRKEQASCVYNAPRDQRQETDVIYITGALGDIPTKRAHKKCTTSEERAVSKSTGHLNVKKIENGDYIGLRIDGNQRFLINDFTVTHNCCNIFSEFFEVETVDAVRKSFYTQRFEKNMTVVNEPVITKYTKKPYTTIRFKPDYQRFGMTIGDALYTDMIEVIKKRVYDACAVTDKDVTVWLNEKKLDFKTFEKYVDLYLGAKVDHVRVHESIGERWEVVASYNDFNGFEHVSFVNGIWTIRGGKHVEYITNQITKKLIELIQKRRKDVTVKPQAVKDNLFVFVKSTIVNPTFDSQSKETLTTPASKFGSKPEISDKFIDKLYKSGIVDKLVEISHIQGNTELKKTDGKKRDTIRGIYKLDDANWAGTSRSHECTLILTEGDSAKTMVIAGLSKVGRDRYGVFPLRGKLLNVKDVPIKKIMENEEICNLKKILGLESGKEYKSVSELRYGKIMILVDQDVDGSHIKGLLFNMFHCLWPSLMIDHNFITCMMTPIIKVSKAKDVLSFYNITDFERWKEANDAKGWSIKYYKGLGTSTEEEAMKYFQDMRTVDYMFTGEPSHEKLELAFNKKKADDRKAWLGQYDRQQIVDYMDKQVSYEDFVDKELIHFSNYDLERSIPSICDGFKVSQRKILYSCFKKNLTEKEIRVAQLAAYVSENAAYHHGEASLQAAIVSMAQDFVGSNNVNLLMPNGQFGSRVAGGKDASQPRYIHTLLTPLALNIYRKEDLSVLTYLDDDGLSIEPEFYMPILPMVLINGAVGIGTGFSTNVPCYNPDDVVRVLRMLLDGKDVTDDIAPWYHGFEGAIELSGVKHVSRGVFKRVGSTKIQVLELPIGFWTEDFKIMLEDMLGLVKKDDKDSKAKKEKADKQILKNYEANYTHCRVDFTLHFTSAQVVDDLMTLDNNGYTKFENVFKLVSSKNMSTTNMYLFNEKGQITKYDKAVDVIKAYFHVRMAYYQKRKEYISAKLQKDIDMLNNKIRFIRAIISKEIEVSAYKKVELEELLGKLGYQKFDDSYDYLVRIPIYNMTKDKVQELEDDIVRHSEKLEYVQRKSTAEMWSDDLDTFDEGYRKYCLARASKYLHEDGGGGAAKGQTAAKKVIRKKTT